MKNNSQGLFGTIWDYFFRQVSHANHIWKVLAHVVKFFVRTGLEQQNMTRHKTKLKWEQKKKSI